MSTSLADQQLNQSGQQEWASEYVSPHAAEWKQEISARVQAHRLRRQAGQLAMPAPEAGNRRNPRVNSVVASVMERYAGAPSYCDYIAALTAPQPAPAASNASDSGYGSGTSYDFDFATSGSSALDMFAAPAIAEESAPSIELVAPAEGIAATVSAPLENDHHSARMRSEVEAPAVCPDSPQTSAEPVTLTPMNDAVAQAMVEPVKPLTTKLIEFPRQLIAARRARPRVAEGPLLSDAAPLTIQEVAAETPQLRIFEVELEQDHLPTQSVAVTLKPASTLVNGIDPALAAAAAALPPEWRYIQLDTPLLPGPATFADQQAHDEAATALLDVAPMNRRLLAAAFDLAMVTLGFLAFAVAFVTITSHPPVSTLTDPLAILAAAGAFAALAIGYQWLFLTLSDATPGMRYARIALCTFGDDNPTRRARRSRLMGTLLAAGTAGLGFAWIWFDQESLGWHDRISRTYQRCY